MGETCKFNNIRIGIPSYTTDNIGDDIQSFVLTQVLQDLLPGVTVVPFDRDKPEAYPQDVDISMVSGWWFLGAEFRVHNPVFFGFCKGTAPYIWENDLELFRNAGPIGCRDTRTLNWCKDNGLPAFYSGCVTSMLERGWVVDEPRDEQDIIMCVDIPKLMMPDRVQDYLDYVTHEVNPDMDQGSRAVRMGQLLQLYAQAKMVVTPRLHAALPALAMGTSALIVSPPDMVYRFTALPLSCKLWERYRLKDISFNPDDYHVPMISYAASCRAWLKLLLNHHLGITFAE